MKYKVIQEKFIKIFKICQKIILSILFYKSVYFIYIKHITSNKDLKNNDISVSMHFKRCISGIFW